MANDRHEEEIKVQHGCWTYIGVFGPNGGLKVGSVKIMSMGKPYEPNDTELSDAEDNLFQAHGGHPYKGMTVERRTI